MEKLLLLITAASVLCAINSLSTREYYFVYEQKTWQEAQRYCRETYTDLVTIKNMEILKILETKANATKMPTWIGLYENLNTWRWSFSNTSVYQPGEEMYRNWASGAPNNSDGRESCATINDDGLWDDVPCSLTLNPVCSDFNGTDVTFSYIDTVMNWVQADTYCKEHHNDLAIVRNLEENQQIQGLNKSGSLWIGLHRDAWKWSDGTRAHFTNWRKGEPNGAEDCCASIDFADSGVWQDRDCGERLVFICYWDVPVLRRVVKLKLVKPSSVDLNDPAIEEELLNKLKEKLKEQGLNEDMKIRNLRWRKQPNGKVFHKEK
ncbi:PREDICTED: macrophage mannose receptor 1-like [Cyprinodon variegatus]|nr:PREDICTED: macrophage mannose receptor 1-like [Cyprinodon variegatus]